MITPYFYLFFLSLFLWLQKLQFIQNEKNKEIEALRQRVRELEQQSLYSLMDPRLKRKKNWDLLWSVHCNVRANLILFHSCENMLNLFNYVLCYVLNLINEYLWTYSCEECYVRGPSKGLQWQVTLISGRLRPVNVVRTPVNTTAMFQIKLVISLIETLAIKCLPHAHRRVRANTQRKCLPCDIKYQENAGSFKESDCWNKWLRENFKSNALRIMKTLLHAT